MSETIALNVYTAMLCGQFYGSPAPNLTPSHVTQDAVSGNRCQPSVEVQVGGNMQPPVRLTDFCLNA